MNRRAYLCGFSFPNLNQPGCVNFLLKNLELELEERHLLVGEKLLEDGKVTKLSENERHLWIAQVEGHETEVQISPSRVRACTCECGVFEQEKMCGHLAATLLALRRKLLDAAVPKEKKQRRPPLYQKLTVTAVLENEIGRAHV